MTIKTWAGLCFAACVMICCSGCSKNLNESRAKSLIEDELAKASYSNPNGGAIDSVARGLALNDVSNFNDIPYWLNNTTVDNLADSGHVAALNVGAQEMNRLLVAGFATQTNRRVEYPLPPNMAGDAITHIDTNSMFYQGFQPPPMHFQFSISIMENTGNIIGNYKISGDTPNNVPCSNSISGNAKPQGTLEIRLQPDCLGENGIYGPIFPVTLSRNGSTGTLSYPVFGDQIRGMTTLNLSGPLSPHIPSVTWFNYSLTQKLAPYRMMSGRFKIGQIHVKDVRNLTLVGNDVQARSSFSWAVDLNDLGKAVLGSSNVTGSGAAVFSKKPDGEWILTSYSL